MPDARALAATYFSAWDAGDADALRSVLAEDVDFQGPLGTARGREECVAGLAGMRAHVATGIEVELQLVDGHDALTWFAMRTAAGTLPVVNRMHVGPAGIERIRVVFDPRPLVAQPRT